MAKENIWINEKNQRENIGMFDITIYGVVLFIVEFTKVCQNA